MMSRFCRYIDKCFHFHELLPHFRDARKKPHVPGTSVFASVFGLFAGIYYKGLFPQRRAALCLRG